MVAVFKILGHVFTSRLSEVPRDSLVLEGDSDTYRLQSRVLSSEVPPSPHQLPPAQKQLKDRQELQLNIGFLEKQEPR